MKNQTTYYLLIAIMILTTFYLTAQLSLDFENPEKDQNDLVATLIPTEGNRVIGEITFSRKSRKIIEVTIIVAGLEPGGTHAVHIHEFGDITKPNGSSAGDHFNPGNQPHGLPEDIKRHAGDLGNITADAKGLASKTFETQGISLTNNGYSILGRSVVVHAAEDKGTQPSGDAGPRIAVGVVGIKNPW